MITVPVHTIRDHVLSNIPHVYRPDAPNTLRATAIFHRLPLGAKRENGDYWLSNWGEMIEITHLWAWSRKRITERMCPHYRLRRIDVGQDVLNTLS